jgi:hypothetical protein
MGQILVIEDNLACVDLFFGHDKGAPTGVDMERQGWFV